MVLVEAVYGVAWLIFAPIEWTVRGLVDWAPNNKFKFIEVFAVLIAVTAFFIDYTDRKEERLVRMWNLATDKREGNSGKIPALEFLNKQGKALEGISIPNAYLFGVNLKSAFLRKANLKSANLSFSDLRYARISGGVFSESELQSANLNWADLSNADLRGAQLLDADFSNANLSYANFTAADFYGASLRNTNIGGTDFRNAKNLTQRQIDDACIGINDAPPKLPNHLAPPAKFCDPGFGDEGTGAGNAPKIER